MVTGSRLGTRVTPSLVALILAAGLMLGGAASAAPRRVVSMNLCTDQLAMMLAAPGQLISISHLGHDPAVSPMADRARAYGRNHGHAEELFRLRPDLVLAGRYSGGAAVAMLERLGVPVLTLAPARDLTEVRENIHQLGQALGQEARAARMIADFDAGLATLRAARDAAPDARPLRAAIYDPNGYSWGNASLAGQIVTEAGLHNIATELGITSGGQMALETLVLSDPDMLIRSPRYATASHAEEVLSHPALTALLRGGTIDAASGPDWSCGTPQLLGAIAALRAAAAQGGAAGGDTTEKNTTPGHADAAR